MWIIVVLAALVAVASSQSCSCRTMKWATCEPDPCVCTLLLGNNEKQVLNCDKMVPKCFLMKAEMFRLKKGQRAVGKPVEHAFVDNDGIYDPDCESDGTFKAKQCNGTDTCWCVNSAGVRRTDKGDANLKCEKLVYTHWLRFQMKHKELPKAIDQSKLKDAIANAISERYDNFNKSLVENVEYDPDGRVIVVDVKKEIGDRTTDLTHMAYYLEKDIKDLPLFKDQAKFEPAVNGQNLAMEDVLVYYVDEEPPTFTMKALTGGIIAVIVVVVLLVVVGLLLLFFLNRRQNMQQKQYAKAEPREMEAM
ncbi:epithelial cell adhesion molecule [Thalassophryne amazonica]|uniref:epithelial cell adhesion molecule n=1 Tax=Thalassophryne amazonica TaxID=390379 RepID=UPI0014713951|nr:epithelial cell adhesion molecule [Thalassophryne amazonica]